MHFLKAENIRIAFRNLGFCILNRKKIVSLCVIIFISYLIKTTFLALILYSMGSVSIFSFKSISNFLSKRILRNFYNTCILIYFT